MLLSTAYAPPVQYFCKLFASPLVKLEAHEHYIKQTYRSRCHIATAQGMQPLSIPVASGASSACPIREVRISDHGHWQHNHWQAIRTAYGASAFFDYLAPEIAPFYERSWTFLFDYNFEMLQTLLRLSDIDVCLELTTDFCTTLDAADPITQPSASQSFDYRFAIRPKNPPMDPYFIPACYYQTNAARTGFIPNLSILDLLFECGPETPLVLKRSIHCAD
ncbi:hypothetical protein HQ45_00570 [Porphyromonas crevioricanis]|uniref:WbqC family protein n=1 Tax=Porphyromonas crevioricanis TaxID=393921 RepID=UPI00052C97C5|nr:WbqC family protein [Porphyromonas crevioricanis]KGN91303.1 hypothetical protein HQ45_00570 [Porphyromonas crevioricanis]